VFDYVPGKVDWLAYGLPVEGEEADSPMVIDRMQTDVPTCRLNDSLREAKQRAEKLSFNLCAVVNEEGIVLGLVREEMWKEGQALAVEKVMELGPTTFRPSYTVDDATEFLTKQELDAALITSSDGKLMGVFRRSLDPDKKQIPKSEIWA
jgi:CBS domain-containing protein